MSGFTPFNYTQTAGVVPPGSISNAELANMAARTVKVNATNASASPQDLQGTVALSYLRVNAAGTGLEWGALPVDPGLVTSVFSRTGAVVATNGDYTASQVTNVAAGGISAVTVQAAINELDTEKYTPAANTLPLADLVNAGAQYDIVGRKTATGGAWEDCTRAQLLLAGTDLANTFALGQLIDLSSGALAATPSSLAYGLRVAGADSTTMLGVFFDQFNATNVLGFRRAAGTRAAPTGTTGDIVVVNAYGHDNSAYVAGSKGQLRMTAPATWSSTSNPVDLVFEGTPTGSTSRATSFTAKGGGAVIAGSPTGGDTGIGTLNAVNYFDDGVNINAIYAGLAAANVFTGANSVVGSGLTPGTAPLTLQSNDPGTAGAALVLVHNSASPAAADLNRIRFYFNDSLGAQQLMAGMNVFLEDPTAGAWASRYSFFTGTAGAATTKVNIKNGLYTNGVNDGGVDTVSTLNYYANNLLVIDSNALLRTRAYTVGTLPAAAGVIGAIARVTDALVAPVYAAAATGGGTTFAKVVSDGTIWRYG